MSLSVAGLVASAASKAASGAMDEIGLLMGVRTEIWYIKDELRIMQAFLRNAEMMKNRDEMVKVWAEQIEDLSYDIKYCLDEFRVNFGDPGCFQHLTKLRDRHQIAVQIQNLKIRVGEVSARIQRYSHLRMPITSSSIDERKTYQDMLDSLLENTDINSHNFLDESEPVGISKAKDELIKMMDISNEDAITAKVICVVGVCGIGKSTLVRKIYESNIVNKFSCAWIKESYPVLGIEMLKDMIKQLLGVESFYRCLRKSEGEAWCVEDYTEYLREGLKDKRYFIVLDNLLTSYTWRWINDALKHDRNNGSRVIVTTRDVGVAKGCTSASLVYFLKPLQIDDATNLLLRKAKKTQRDIEYYDTKGDIVTKILDKCGYLPLAIVIIGGMLVGRNVLLWEDVYQQLPTGLQSNSSKRLMWEDSYQRHPTRLDYKPSVHITAGGLLAGNMVPMWEHAYHRLTRRLKWSPGLDDLWGIVVVSYYNLPSRLKPCFMHLSIFPRDFEIQTRHLIDRWIVEGFVTSQVGKNIEDVATSYLYELIIRGMIQPSRMNLEGRIKSCRVHDAVFDIMQCVSRDETFVYFTSDIVTSESEENFRHVAHHGGEWPKISMDWSHVRSFTVFDVIPMDPKQSVFSSYLRMLSVLDLQDAQCGITQKDISNIGLLRRLKYVNVRGHSNISALPRSIGKLHGLQYLDVKNSSITSLPKEISKLLNLCSLRCSSEKTDVDGPQEGLMHTVCLPMVFTFFCNCGFRSKSGGVRVPRGMGALKELQILEIIDIKSTSSRAVKELGELMQLRKLSVVTIGATKQKCKILCVAIGKLTSLRSLNVDAGRSSLEWLDYFVSPPVLVRSLRLVGLLREMPDWFGYLMHLEKIYLKGSQLEGVEAVELLGGLSNLRLLALHFNAYVGETLVFGEGAFRNLRKLDIYFSTVLREVRFEEGTSPQMEKMEFSLCGLEFIGVKHLPKLTEISLGSSGKVVSLGVLQGEVDAHPNRPVLRLQEEWSYHDLGDFAEGSTSASVQVEEATPTGEGEESSSLHPDPAAAGETSSSQSQVVVVSRDDGSDSEDDLR